MTARVLLFLAALALSACAFSSEEAFFSADEGAHPISNGARYVWRAPGDDPLNVTFHRSGGGYELTERNHPEDRMLGVLLIAVPETPVDDYIVQWQSERGDEARIYAFMWPHEDGYRIFSDPDTFTAVDGTKPQHAYCEERAYGECMFRTREALLAFYQNVVYPTLSDGGATSEEYLDLTPVSGAPERKSAS